MLLREGALLSFGARWVFRLFGNPRRNSFWEVAGLEGTMRSQLNHPRKSPTSKALTNITTCIILMMLSLTPYAWRVLEQILEMGTTSTDLEKGPVQLHKGLGHEKGWSHIILMWCRLHTHMR